MSWSYQVKGGSKEGEGVEIGGSRLGNLKEVMMVGQGLRNEKEVKLQTGEQSAAHVNVISKAVPKKK